MWLVVAGERSVRRLSIEGIDGKYGVASNEVVSGVWSIGCVGFTSGRFRAGFRDGG